MRIQIEPDEILDIIVLLIKDQLKDDNYDKDNERLNLLYSNIKEKGLLPIINKYYLETPLINRNKYKFIKNVFFDKESRQNEIYIIRDKEEKPSLIKRLLKRRNKND
jgi:hypothetical protein